MAYIGNQPSQVAFLTDLFNGTGSQTAFTMSVAPANPASVLVAVSGVLQSPDTYSIVGTTITFSGAPPSGTGNISTRYLGIPASGVTTTAYRTVTEFTATAGQTTFTPPSYTVGFIDVLRNGVRLGSADYTATNGTTVVLTSGAVSGDLITTVSFYVSSVLNAIPATAGSVGTTYLAAGSVTQPILGNNVAGTGPAFSAYPISNATISSAVETVVINNAKNFDTNGCFNNTGSTVTLNGISVPAYSFAPNVAGYYFITATLDSESSVSLTRFIISIGSASSSYRVSDTSVGYGPSVATGSILLYMNGTSDWVNARTYIVAATPVYSGSVAVSRFSGQLVRAV